MEQNGIGNLYSAILCKRISIALNALILRKQSRLKGVPKVAKTDRQWRNSVGSEFQTVRPATEKAQWSNVIRWQCSTISWCWSADRRCRLLTAVTGVQWTLKYFGALFSRHKQTVTASFYLIPSGTSSQCNGSWSRLDSNDMLSWLYVQVSYNQCYFLQHWVHHTINETAESEKNTFAQVI